VREDWLEERQALDRAFRELDQNREEYPELLDMSKAELVDLCRDLLDATGDMVKEIDELADIADPEIDEPGEKGVTVRAYIVARVGTDQSFTHHAEVQVTEVEDKDILLVPGLVFGKLLGPMCDKLLEARPGAAGEDTDERSE
jgi:hypothetical protein